MEVSITGMENVRTPHGIFNFHLLNRLEYVPEASSGDRAIHAIVVGRYASGCGKGILATGPEQQALVL